MWRIKLIPYIVFAYFIMSIVSDKVNLTKNLHKMPKPVKLKNVIILAKARSGSNLLTKLLTTRNSFMIIEPILDLYGSSPTRHGNNSALIEDLLHCNFKRFTKENNTKLKLLFVSPIVETLCNDEYGQNQFCGLDERRLVEYICEKSKTVVTKTVFLSFREAMEAVMNNTTTAIFHLIRDPRAIIASRVTWKNIFNDTIFSLSASTICNDLSNDFNYAGRFRSLFPKSYLLVRHEDLVYHPRKSVKRLYEFLGREYTIKEDFIVKSLLHTKPEKSNIFDVTSTSRDSKAVPNSWRKQLSFEHVLEIQRVCGDILKKMNYRLIHSRADLLNESLRLY